MTEADTNSLEMVESDSNLHFEDAVQHDALFAGGFYKVCSLNIYEIK